MILPSGRLIRGRALHLPLPSGPPPEFGVYLLGESPPPAEYGKRAGCTGRTCGCQLDHAVCPGRTLTEAWRRAECERVEVACMAWKRPDRHRTGLHRHPVRGPARTSRFVRAPALPPADGGDTPGSAGTSPGLRPRPREARRPRDARRPRVTGRPSAQIVNKTLPRARPSCIYSIAAGASASVNVLSMTGLILPSSRSVVRNSRPPAAPRTPCRSFSPAKRDSAAARRTRPRPPVHRPPASPPTTTRVPWRASARRSTGNGRFPAMSRITIVTFPWPPAKSSCM